MTATTTVTAARASRHAAHRLRRGLVAGVCAAVSASLLYGAVPAAAVGTPSALPSDAASADIPGVQSVGPIAVVASTPGSLWPDLPLGVAEMPRGTVLSGRSPLVHVPALESVAAIDVRVRRLSTGQPDDIAWTGTLRRGWATIAATLIAGEEFAVEVRQNGWAEVGTFSVSPRATGAGPAASTGGMNVSRVTGQISWSWASRPLAGPGGSVGIGLTWAGDGATSPGLPTGWRVAVHSGSPWARLAESAAEVSALDLPAAPALRSTADGALRVSLSYPTADLDLADRIVVSTRSGDGRWATAGRLPKASAKPGSDGMSELRTSIPAPTGSQVEVRVGVVTDDTTVWSRSTRVASAAEGTRASAALPGAGRGSILTSGSLPAVVRLLGWDGSSLTFVRDPLGVYEQVGGAKPGFVNALVWVGARTWEFTDTQGVTTRFENGRAVSVSENGAALSRLEWGTGGRLVAVTNEVGRTLRLEYAGTETCQSANWTRHGFAAVPTGMLCAVRYPGGDTTEFGYVSVGAASQIGLVRDPGNVGGALGWDTRGRLVSTRSALAGRVAAAGTPAAAGVLATVRYDASGRVVDLVDAPATPGGARVTTRLTFPEVTEQVLRDWSAQPGQARAVQASVATVGVTGFALSERTWLDPVSWQSILTRDASGLELSQSVVNDRGVVRQSRDAQGRLVRMRYDSLGLVERVTGPFAGTADSGSVLESDYDTRRENGRDVAVSGLRTRVFSSPRFSGASREEFWESSFSRGGLSAQWSGRAAEFSAQATGVWTPPAADDRLGSENGWRFTIEVAPGSEAQLVIGSTTCVVAAGPCTVRHLSTGPKAVTVVVPRAGRAGWFRVQAAPVGRALADIAMGDLQPGFSLQTAATSNDVLPGSPTGARTDYTYNFATQDPTLVVAPGDLRTRMAYEPEGGSGSWGRLLTVTSPGGMVQQSAYHPDRGTSTVPAPCTGEGVASGQLASVTRSDGTGERYVYDVQGRVIARTTVGRSGVTAMTCVRYAADGTVSVTEEFNPQGVLIERERVEPNVGGDPLVTRTVIHHGAASPLSPGETRTTLTRIDLASQPVSVTDVTGTRSDMAYDVLGNLVRVDTTPPAGSGSGPLVIEYDYGRIDGQLRRVTVNGVVAATVAYDAQTGQMRTVTYPNGIASAMGYAGNGVVDSVRVTSGDARFTRVVSTTRATAFGRIIGSRVAVTGTAAMTEDRSFSFDAAGRLASASIVTESGGGRERRDFAYRYDATQAAACGSSAQGAGRDGLRTGGSRDGVSFITCHDASGRVTSTTDPLIAGARAATVTHDAFGRVTRIDGARTLALTWGAGTELAGLIEDGSGPRVETTLDRWGGAIVDSTIAVGDDVVSVRSAGPFTLSLRKGAVRGTASIRYPLPGGAFVTTAPGAGATLTVAGVEGAALVTLPVPALGSGPAAAPGDRVGMAERFGPFGEPLSTVRPATREGVPLLGWQAGTSQRTLVGTSSVTLMGVRPYHPALGEFLAQDPLIDSGANPYSYADGDPVNASDISGGESHNTGLWAGLGALAGVALAFGGGYIAGNLTGVGRFIGAAMAVGGVVGTAASTYIAVSSATGDQTAAITMAVVAALVSATMAVVGYGMSSSKVAALAEHRALQNPDGIPWTDALSPTAQDKAAGTLWKGEWFRDEMLARGSVGSGSGSGSVASLWLPDVPAAPVASSLAGSGGSLAGHVSDVSSRLSSSSVGSIGQAAANPFTTFGMVESMRKAGVSQAQIMAALKAMTF